MKALRRFSAAIALVVFGGLLWLAIYAYQEGFTKKWRKLIVEEFAKHDLNISFEKLTIDPFQGLVANDVLLLEHGTKQEVARISKVRLDLDLAKFIRKERFLERIELESAHLSLPYQHDIPGQERLELRGLDAIVMLARGRIEVARARANFHGLQLRLSGSVLRPGEGESPVPFGWEAAKLQGARPILEALVGQLQRLHPPQGRPPVLEMIIAGDLARPETLSLKAHLQGHDLHYGDFVCREIAGEATLTEDALQLSNLTLRDDHGRLAITGQFPLRGDPQVARIALDSSIALGSLLPAIHPDLPLWSWMTFLSAPEISFQGTLSLKTPFLWTAPPVDLVGRLSTGRFRLGEEPFEHLSGDFHLQGARFIARNISVKHVLGKSQGKILATPERGLRYEFTVGMDPTVLSELPLTDEINAFLQRWEFGPSSGVIIELAGERKGQDAAAWDHRGRASLTDCQFASAGVERLTFDFQLNPHAYHFSDVEARLRPDPSRGYSGGTVKAQRISVSARDHLTMFTNATGYIDPGQIVRCFSPKAADQLDRFRFSQPPEIRIPRGTIDPEGIAQTNLQVEVKAGGTMTTEVFHQPLPLEEPRFGLLFHKENLIVRADHAGLFGGHLQGNLDIRNLSDTRDYTAKVELTNVDFGPLSQVYFPEYESDGQLTGHLSWRGNDQDWEAVEGKGVCHLRQSRRPHVPVLTPLSSLLRMLGAAAGDHPITVEDLGAEFSIQAALLTLEKVQADLDPYRVQGQGTIHLDTKAIDLNASLISHPAHRSVVDVLFEMFGQYHCGGTLEDPKWTLVTRLEPGDLLEAAGNWREGTQRESDSGEGPESTSQEAARLLEKLLSRRLKDTDPRPVPDSGLNEHP